MKKKAVVLGCGMVGATMARDLAADCDIDVIAADVSASNLRRLDDCPAISTVEADLGHVEQLRKVIEPADVVVGALPSAIGFESLRAIIESGKSFADICFMPENAMEWDGLAKDKGVTAVVDCGVSPGLSNLMVGHAFAQLDKTERALIYVGGLPKNPTWPYHYKAPFAPSDVIEEYTRPARLVQDGQVVTRPALSEPELIEFAPVGTLEAFNTDGLRTLLTTLDIPDMVEKTLRYPGHIELMRVLRETGFFSKEMIDVGGVSVRPLDVTSKLLFSMWALAEGEEEFTILRVTAEGTSERGNVRHVYDLFAEYDKPSGTTSMARTTAFPCTIVARMLLDGTISEPGVIPPELLAQQPGVFDRMVEQLAARGVVMKWKRESV